MDDPQSAQLAAVRTEEFENLASRHATGVTLTRREEEKLWKQADLKARERLGLPTYGQVKWGERYYDHSGLFPGWRKKERPNYLLGISVVAFFIFIWWLGS